VAEESGDIYYKTPAYISYGALSYVKGDFDTAESYLLQALAFSEKTGHYTNWMTAGQHIFELYISMGKYKEARKYFEKMISIIEPTKYRLSEIGLYIVGLARAKVLNSDEVLKYHSDIRSKAMQHRCARYICDILLNIDLHMDKAEDWIKKTIEMDKKNGFMFFLSQNYARYAELFMKTGNLPKANENLNKAIEILRESGADGWVEKFEKQLAALS
jgi:tetratricopeptide (TPR) repeat protein